jgi:hypothetical protein
VRNFADKAGIGMPEVGIFEGDPNAFATGAFKNSALVAVSTGLLQNMTHEEVEAVIGHEVAHIANGDMVTMTLIQGVMNTFVVFLSRVIGYAVDSFLRKNDENSSGPGIGYMVTTIVLDIVLGFAGSHHRGLVLAPARIPCRRRCRPAHGPPPAHDQRPGPPGWRAHAGAAQEHGCHGYCRGHWQTVQHPPAHRRAHCGACRTCRTRVDGGPARSDTPTSARWLRPLALLLGASHLLQRMLLARPRPAATAQGPPVLRVQALVASPFPAQPLRGLSECCAPRPRPP